MSEYQYQTIVIGSGPAGLAAAFSLASHGQKVAIIEKYLWGGTCPNYGCDPKKILLTAVETVERQNHLKNFGVEGQTKINWPALQAYRKDYVDAVDARKIKGLDQAKIEHIKGLGKFVDQHTIQIDDGQLLTAENMIIAVGQRPKTLDFPGSEFLLDSEQFLKMEELPESVLLIGTGYVGMEFATIMATAGVKTYLSSHGKQVLKDFDQELVAKVITNLEAKQVEFMMEKTVVKIEKVADKFKVTFDDQTTIEVQAVYNAAGRVGNADLIDAEKANIKINQKQNVIVDQYMKAADNIYAIGDVAEAGVDKLVPTGNFQGMYVAYHILGKNTEAIKYPTIAAVAFTSPKIAKVGIKTDTDDSKITTKVFDMQKVITFYRANDQAVVKSALDDQTMVGATVVSELAEELINSFVEAINHKQTVADALATLYAYPSLASDMAGYF